MYMYLHTYIDYLYLLTGISWCSCLINSVLCATFGAFLCWENIIQYIYNIFLYIFYVVVLSRLMNSSCEQLRYEWLVRVSTLSVRHSNLGFLFFSFLIFFVFHFVLLCLYCYGKHFWANCKRYKTRQQIFNLINQVTAKQQTEP